MKTIIAAFSDQNAANAAIAYLQSQRIQDTRVLDASASNAVTELRDLDVPDDRAQAYADMARRGAVIVAAQTEADAHAIARELDSFGSLDVDAERVGALETEREMRTDSDTERELRQAPETERDIDVVEERVAIGKEEVPRGGVRVRTFVAERPVREDVQLREERIDVSREPVNERISASPLEGTLGEEEFEVTARGEEVVVGKEARVVERVHVGKTEETRTERVEATERRRDVEVEPIETETAEPTTPRTRH